MTAKNMERAGHHLCHRRTQNLFVKAYKHIKHLEKKNFDVAFAQMTKPTVEQKGCSIVGCGYVYGECNLLRGYKAPPGPRLTGGGILVDILGGRGDREGERSFG